MSADHTSNTERREDVMTQQVTTATVQEHANKGLALTERCDRCGAHAHVFVLLASGSALLFCGHHAEQSWDGLVALPNVLIDDHRPFLRAQEEALKHPAVKS